MTTKRKMIEHNKDRKIDKNWNEIFNFYDIVEQVNKNGLFYITSKEINDFIYKKGSRVDARNMTKFDFVKSLPDIFRNNDLSILPVSRGKYVIGKFKAYTEIENIEKEFRKDRKEISFPNWIESLDYEVITSESAVVNVAYISGMIKEIFGVDHLVETVSGRMSSKGFDFFISDIESDQSHKINVENSQIEIDAGFETEDSLILVEVKNNETETFITRQLYYPYRLWLSKINKKIIPVFLQYSDGVYNFSIYTFSNPNDYSSIELVDRYNFLVAEDEIKMNEIIQLIETTEFVKEPLGIPFPQADSLQRVLDTMMTIYSSDEGMLTIEELTIINDFHYRQADYYINAGRYLGLMEKEKGSAFLSSQGIELMNKSTKDRKLGLVKAIMSHKPFNDIALKRLEVKEHISGPEAYKLLKDKSHYMDGFSKSTRFRRASTVAAWIKEILTFSNEY